MKVIHNEPEFRPFAIQIETREEAQLLFSLLGAVSITIERGVTGKVVNSITTYEELRRALGKDAVFGKLAITLTREVSLDES